MRLIKFTRADGTIAYANPLLIRAIVVADKQYSAIQFDNDHVLLIREGVEKLASEIEAAAQILPDISVEGQLAERDNPAKPA